MRAGFTVLLLAALYLLRSRSTTHDQAGNAGAPAVTTTDTAPTAAPRPGTGEVAEAFHARRSNVQVVTGGRVIRVLPDDREGSRHQRFIIRVDRDVSVLVAHNIDLAPRVPVAPGDSVELRGEYEWSPRGGVIHWTHRDPDARREAGWIRRDGRLFQ